MIVDIKKASQWATEKLNKNVSPHNISYLINYGRIKKIEKDNRVYVDLVELEEYYNNLYALENEYKKKYKDIEWELSFDWVKESERTKHVHRLHPYKGKFIPQLVEYFLDEHIDNLKKEVYFKKGDIVIDPFCGSGTTLIQANELGIHSIGIDISPFNAFISNVKLIEVDFSRLEKEINKIIKKLDEFTTSKNYINFENELNEKLVNFNNKFFPSPEFKVKVKNKDINEKEYGGNKEREFLKIYEELLKKYNVTLINNGDTFLDKWYIKSIREEIDFVFNLIKQVEDENIKKVVSLILSRTIRSCRATTHSDLATLKEPQLTPYYCKKHAKICKPLFSLKGWFNRYARDTIKRLKEFNKVRTDVFSKCFVGDSRNINLFEKIKDKEFLEYFKTKKAKGIFTSPPYVGLINYHEQHEYAYELFGFKRQDELEIGAMFNGTSKKAREEYVVGISDVLINMKKFLSSDFDIFIVANDKYNLYPEIAKRARLKIVREFKRPVLNRVEKDKNPYAESIFHMRGV
ncbi:MAG: DNA methyltransferase [Nautiliaceae bacterium]